MNIYHTYDKDTLEREEFFSLSIAKRWMRERIKLGHDVSGHGIRYYANGDWVELGEITLTGNNKVFIANTKMTTKNY